MARFSDPIEKGQDRDATPRQVERSADRAAELRRRLRPHLLQRSKDDVRASAKAVNSGHGECPWWHLLISCLFIASCGLISACTCHDVGRDVMHSHLLHGVTNDVLFPCIGGLLIISDLSSSLRCSCGPCAVDVAMSINHAHVHTDPGHLNLSVTAGTVAPAAVTAHTAPAMGDLPSKTEVVLWTALAPQQRRAYADFINGGRVADVLSGATNPLASITYLKKACGHTLMLPTVADTVAAAAAAVREGEAVVLCCVRVRLRSLPLLLLCKCFDSQTHAAWQSWLSLLQGVQRCHVRGGQTVSHSLPATRMQLHLPAPSRVVRQATIIQTTTTTTAERPWRRRAAVGGP